MFLSELHRVVAYPDEAFEAMYRDGERLESIAFRPPFGLRLFPAAAAGCFEASFVVD